MKKIYTTLFILFFGVTFFANAQSGKKLENSSPEVCNATSQLEVCNFHGNSFRGQFKVSITSPSLGISFDEITFFSGTYQKISKMEIVPYGKGSYWKGVVKKTGLGEGNDTIIFALTDGGYVIEYVLRESTFGVHWNYKAADLVPTGGSASYYKAFGDAIYAVTSSGIYVSRDTLQSFQLTTGMGQPTDAALDTAQNVYGIDNSGLLYYQNADSNIWHQRTATGMTTNAHNVFVDKQNRIYVTNTNQTISVSSNGGNTFPVNFTNAIVNGYGADFAEDSLGHVFIHKGNNIAYTNNGGTSWTLVSGAALDAFAFTPPMVVNHISADSGGVFAATPLGVFYSTDLGVTWQPEERKATHKHFIKANDGSWLVTNDGGIWRKMPNDTVWTKTFPGGNSFANMNEIFKTNTGILYACVSLANHPANSSSRDKWGLKSIDNGQTWALDTAGFHAAFYLGSIYTDGVDAGNAFYVDEHGNQYLGDAEAGLLNTFIKPFGGVWQIDTLGKNLSSPSSFMNVSAFVSDGVANV